MEKREILYNLLSKGRIFLRSNAYTWAIELAVAGIEDVLEQQKENEVIFTLSKEIDCHGGIEYRTLAECSYYTTTVMDKYVSYAAELKVVECNPEGCNVAMWHGYTRPVLSEEGCSHYVRTAQKICSCWYFNKCGQVEVRAKKVEDIGDIPLDDIVVDDDLFEEVKEKFNISGGQTQQAQQSQQTQQTQQTQQAQQSQQAQQAQQQNSSVSWDMVKDLQKVEEEFSEPKRGSDNKTIQIGNKKINFALPELKKKEVPEVDIKNPLKLREEVCKLSTEWEAWGIQKQLTFDFCKYEGLLNKVGAAILALSYLIALIIVLR